MIHRSYEYQLYSVAHFQSIGDAANICAQQGWRTVGIVIPAEDPNARATLLIEKEIVEPMVILHSPEKLNAPENTRRRWWNPKSW